MFRLLLVILLMVFVVFAALAIWAFKLWGFWGFVGAVLAFVAFFWILAKLFTWGLKRVFLMPFKMKGAVLKNAVLTVHSITPAGPPVIDADYDAEDGDAEDDDAEDVDAEGDGKRRMLEHLGSNGDANDDEDDEDDYGDEPDEPLDWYHIDVTITPQASPGPFQLWEPGELSLVPADTASDEMDADDLGHVDGVELWRDNAWQAEDIDKYPGPQRLRLHAGVTRGTRRAKLKYYFEVLDGELELPSLS